MSRQGLLIFALAYSCFCVYGSWVPLRFRAISWQDAWRRFQELPYLQIGMEQRADWVANLLLFVPLSFLWCAVTNVDNRGRWRSVVSAMPMCALLALFSCAIEFSQAWFPDRTMSINDIIAETLGAVVGAIGWLAVGQASIELVRKIGSKSEARSSHYLLTLYCLGYFLYQLLPLDLTLSLHEIWRKYQVGKIELVPFSTSVLGPKLIYEMVRDFVLCVPIGISLAVANYPASRTRSLPSVALLGILLLTTIELLQLFVVSRFSSSSDVVLGMLGILSGWAVARKWLGGRFTEHDPRLAVGVESKRLLVVLAFMASILAPVVLLWFPFDFELNREQIKAAYASFWTVPFAKLYMGTEFNAVSQLLAKVFVFVPLGATCYLVLIETPLRAFKRLGMLCLLCLTTGVGLAIELGQLALPGKYADLTDAGFYVVGACLGFALARCAASQSASRLAG